MKKAAIIIAWVLGSLIVIAGAIWAGFAIYLSPQRITRLIEENSRKYLDADVEIGDLHYKLFRTYPWLEFELDSLTVISRSLDNVSPSIKNQLPQYSDSLLSIAKIRGDINIHSLLHHKINIRELEIQQPKANIVAVNDSVTNFNIAPKMKAPEKMPDIDLGTIRVVTPLNLTYFSLADTVAGRVMVDDFLLTQTDKNKYDIEFAGEVEGHYRNFVLPKAIPVSFGLTVTPHLPQLKADLEKLSFQYAGLKLSLQGKMSLAPNKFYLEQLALDLSVADVFEMLENLPESLISQIPIPEGLEGFLPVNLNIYLPDSYQLPANLPDIQNLDLQELPPFTADLIIDEANLRMSPPGKKEVVVNDVFLDAFLNFNPQNPEETSVEIQELRMNGEGITLSGTAAVNNLIAETQDFKGEFQINTTLMETLSYFLPKNSFKVTGHLNSDVRFNGQAKAFGKDGLKDLTFSGDFSTRALNIFPTAAQVVKMQRVKGDVKGKIPSLPFNNDYSGTLLGFDFFADSISTKANGSQVGLSKLHINLDALDTVKGAPDPSGKLKIGIQKINAMSPGVNFEADGLKVLADGQLNSQGPGSYNSVASTHGEEDALIASRVKHSPLVVEYDGGGILQTVMGMITMDADFEIQKGVFNTSGYLYPVEFSKIEASTNLNRMEFKADKLRAGRSGMAVDATIEGLLAFMTSYSATPLKIDAALRFSNVDINQLSWGYYGAQLASGNDSVYSISPLTPYTAADSVCVVIPRNIQADVQLFSDSACYMQYRFAPLSTNILVNNGDATLSCLSIGAPYCTVLVDWTYSTSHLQNIYMDLKARVEKFRFKPFYSIFPDLTAKAPEIQNLTGEINADVDCHFQMFPDMFMNAPSLKGSFDIKGSDLLFARTGKIERLTHLMLIEGDEPLKIQNLYISGFYHDNLLQLNPFKVSFDQYQLGFAGVMNTDRQMYYHISLEKSPFHVPFGVSLFGPMSHPEIRVGGTHIDNDRAEKVAQDLSTKINANIMAYLHHGWLLFVQEAAKYEASLKDKAQ